MPPYSVRNASNDPRFRGPSYGGQWYGDPGYGFDPGQGGNGYPAYLGPATDAAKRSASAYFGRLGDEDARRWDLGYGLQERAQAMNEQTARARIAEAKRQFDESRRQFDLGFGLDQQRFGLEQQKFGEGQRQFNVGTGLDLLKTGATMRGPLDYFQGEQYARGVQTGGLSPYLQALSTGQTPAFGGGTATTGNPTPLTTQTLINHLVGAAPGVSGGMAQATNNPQVDQFGRPTLSPQAQTALNAINQTAQAGVANLPQGALENLTDDERKAFSSGLSYLGRNPNDEFSMYSRSRAGQGSAFGA